MTNTIGRSAAPHADCCCCGCCYGKYWCDTVASSRRRALAMDIPQCASYVTVRCRKAKRRRGGANALHLDVDTGHSCWLCGWLWLSEMSQVWNYILPPSFYRPLLIHVEQSNNNTSGQQLWNEITFDLEIWHAGSPWTYIGQVRKSRSWVKVFTSATLCSRNTCRHRVCPSVRPSVCHKSVFY